MADLKDKAENLKDKVKGETNEAVGKITGNEEQELKGKIQSKKADMNKKIDDTKDDVVDNVNDAIDEHDRKKRR